MTIVISASATPIIHAQAPETLWTRTYDIGYHSYSIRQSNDGGFAVAGDRAIKTDSYGDSLWTYFYWAFGGSGYRSVAATESLLVFAGWHRDLSGSTTDMASAFSYNGEYRWAYFSGGLFNVRGYSWIDNAQDDGFVLVESYRTEREYDSNIKLTKLSDSGHLLWDRTYGGSEDESAGAIRPDLQDGYIIVGSTSSFGQGYEDGYIIRTDSLGDTIWTRTIGGINPDYFTEVVSTPDSGYMVAGRTFSFGPDSANIWVVRFNSQGDTLWSRTYGLAGLSGDGTSIDRVP